MSKSRRYFLKAGMTAALVAAIPLKNTFSQDWKNRDGDPGDTSGPTPGDPLAYYTKATFKSYVGSIFQLHSVYGIIEVTLLRVDDFPAPPNGECFSLLFRGGSRALRQDTYMMAHGSLGNFLLLLVPVGSDQNGAQGYLATLNRLSPADAARMSPPTRASGGTQRNQGGASSPNATTTPTTTTSPAGNTNTPPPTGPEPAQTDPPKPKKKRKPSWKNKDELFDIGIDDFFS